MSLPEPITRKEQYYDGIAKGNASKLPEPITREEQYLDYIAKNGGGGGGGTTDYEALDNKPSVNSVELSGNKTLDDLGVQGKLTFDNEPTEDSQNPVKSGGVYESLESINEAISEKPDNYADLDDKPSINDVTLSGNKTASDLGLQPTLDGAQTVSGNPITVTDAEPMNAESVKVELEPKQDLHGYDKPWVGGAGKNLLDSNYYSGSHASQSNVDIVKNDDGSLDVTINGSCDGTVNYLFKNTDTSSGLKSGNYKATVKAEGTYTGNINLVLGGASSTLPYSDIALNNVASLTVPSDDAIIGYCLLQIPTGTTVTGTLKLYPMIADEDADMTTFAPYSNICPISGYSEVNVERVGKNLCDHSTITDGVAIGGHGGEYSDPTACTTDFIRIKSGKTVAFSNGFRWGDVYDLDENFTGVQFWSPYHAEENCLIRVTFDLSSKSTIQVEYDDVTTYEPYQGTTYTVSLGGTKYGGILDVTSGVLTVDRAGETFSSNDGWVSTSQSYPHVFQKTLSSKTLKENEDKAINWAKANISGVWYSNGGASVSDLHTVSINTDNLGSYVLYRIDGTTLSDLNTALTSQPLQIVYKLATPLTIQLTPTQIQMLENTNNISSDGTNIRLKYQPNNIIGECKAYTDRECAKVLPPLPTTDGTYHLSCEVTSGVGTLNWVSDS